MRGFRLIIALFAIAGLAAAPAAEAGCLTWFRRVLGWPGAKTEERVEAARAAIAEISATETSPFTKWSCVKNACTAMSPQMAYQLRRRGFPVRLATVQNRVPYLIHGKEVEMESGHMFMVLEGEPPLIVDPTYKQFFNDGYEAPGPEVFVGTIEQLQEYFKARREHLVDEMFHAYTRWDRGRLGGYDVDRFFEKTYGVGVAADSREYPAHYDSHSYVKRIVIEPEPKMTNLPGDED